MSPEKMREAYDLVVQISTRFCECSGQGTCTPCEARIIVNKPEPKLCYWHSRENCGRCEE